jgi:polysaccharide export outer membrane protein
MGGGVGKQKSSLSLAAFTRKNSHSFNNHIVTAGLEYPSVRGTTGSGRKDLSRAFDVGCWLPVGSCVCPSRMRAIRHFVLATLMGLAAVGGHAQDGHAVANRVVGDSSTAGSTPNDEQASVRMTTVSPEPSYVIGADDVLLISVWKEPDLTTTLPVRSDGMISVPLLDDVRAAGLTPMQLAALLTQKLKNYVTAPRVTVVVTQTNSHRIYVLGEVLHTGPIFLLHKMTVLQALATAGFNEFANTKGIYVLRTSNGKEQKIPFNYKRVIKGEASSENILLEPADVIVVP